MTCIVGLVEDGKVYIGADSAAADGWEVRATLLPKVFRNGELIIGYTTSFRMGQILEHHFAVRSIEEGESLQAYMVKGVAEAARECLKSHGFSKVDSNQESGGQFLIGFRGRLFLMDSDFQVNEFADGMEAIGAGRQYALGVLKVLQGDAHSRIMAALEASAYFCKGVLAPFTILGGEK